MARKNKLDPGIQVFQGSLPKPDVYAATAGVGCCDNSTQMSYDKLHARTRFDNGLNHTNPTGGNLKFRFPTGNGWQVNRAEIVQGINEYGKGFNISVLAVPTYAFVTGIGVHIEAEEPGLTFDLVTRNGLVLPTDRVIKAEVTPDGCATERTVTDGGEDLFKGFGALGDAAMIDIFGRSNNGGNFSLEADEIALRVASMPANGIVRGTFVITVSYNFDVIHRAEI